MSRQTAISLIFSHFGALGMGLALGGLMFPSGGQGGAFVGFVLSACTFVLALLWGFGDDKKETPDAG